MRVSPAVLSLFTLSALLSVGAASAQNARQTTLVYGGDWSDLLTMDPAVSYEFTGGLVTDNLYETLVKFEGTDLSKLRPGLATSWKVVNAGNDWKVTFKLRAGQKFSTGNSITSKDVVFSFDRAISLKSSSSFLFTRVANMKVGSTKAVDPLTVEVTIPKTASPAAFLNLLTFNIGGIVDSVEVQKHVANNDFGTAWLKLNSAGSGSFVLNRWDQGQQVVLDANPNSRAKSKLSRIILREIKEANAQKIALESGEIDLAENLTPDMIKAKQTDNKYNLYKADSLVIQYLGMNSGEGQPFADARVRQAVRWALDYDGIVNGLGGGLAKQIQTIVPFGLFGANSALPYKTNVEKAKELLKAAGKPNGFEVEFLINNGSCEANIPCPDLAAKIQSDLAKVGIKANIKQLVEAEQLKTYRAQNAQLILQSWGSDFPDPDGNATPMTDFGAKSLAWRNKWQNDGGAKLTQQAALETNPQKRAALYKQLTELHLNEGWGAMMFQPIRTITLSTNVKGYVRNAQGQVRFEKISKSK